MVAFLVKVLITAVLVGAISELGKRSSLAGALLASLPLTSLLALTWLYRDTGSALQAAQMARGIFWLVLPSLALFLVFPAGVKAGWGFRPALAAGVGATLAAYGALLGTDRMFRLGLFTQPANVEAGSVMLPGFEVLPVLHLVLHVAVPAAVAFTFYPGRRRWAFLWMLAGWLIDIDHLLAEPIYAPGRCSIGFHPLHTAPAIFVYLLLLLPRRARPLGIGLLIHIVLDAIDCETMG